MVVRTSILVSRKLFESFSIKEVVRIFKFQSSNMFAAAPKYIILIIYMQINIVGLPLFKSASTQFWPILGKVCSPVQTDPFMIGLFCGENKPANLDEHFQDFVDEMLTFKQGPADIPIDGHSIPVCINLSCFICDTPARAFVK